MNALLILAAAISTVAAFSGCPNSLEGYYKCSGLSLQSCHNLGGGYAWVPVGSCKSTCSTVNGVPTNLAS
ncbi:UNVERIFIED_CONTAM: hypothetical protein HDU68_004621, partial [Siphonaria sp. JEL0065]